MGIHRSKNVLFAAWLTGSLVVVLGDQFTKILITQSFLLGQAREVLQGHFNLVRAHNTGAAFSFLASGDGWQRWLFTGIGLVAAVLIVKLLHSHASQKLFAFALCLILGGAVGNVLDRMMYGYVVDFLDFYWGVWHFPAFNVADSAITLGAVCLFLDELTRVKVKP
jgi:signal peptidase II